MGHGMTKGEQVVCACRQQGQPANMAGSMAHGATLICYHVNKARGARHVSPLHKTRQSALRGCKLLSCLDGSAALHAPFLHHPRPKGRAALQEAAGLPVRAR